MAQQKDIPQISPAFRWAQSVRHIYLEVKWATRFDSPACLDTYDHQHSVNSANLNVQAMCRNDGKLMEYVLSL